MTAASSEPPAADSPTPGTETCACRHSLLLHDGGEACTAPGCPCTWFYEGRPDFAAPAETQQDDELSPDAMQWEPGPTSVEAAAWALVKRCRRMLDNWSESSTEVRARDLWAPLHIASEDLAYVLEDVAAQPSADTETLADQFMSSALDNIGAFDGSNDEARDRAYVRVELVALLGGPR